MRAGERRRARCRAIPVPVSQGTVQYLGEGSARYVPDFKRKRLQAEHACLLESAVQQGQSAKLAGPMRQVGWNPSPHRPTTHKGAHLRPFRSEDSTQLTSLSRSWAPTLHSHPPYRVRVPVFHLGGYPASCHWAKRRHLTQDWVL